MIRIAGWFGGIGADTKAFKRSGRPYEVVDYVEYDKWAVMSYNAINGTNFKPTDISDVDVSKYGELDLLVAGWPCQDLSNAGKNLGMKKGNRSNLIYVTVNKLKEMPIKPKYILLENVKGLLGKKHAADFEEIKRMFEELGYDWNQVLLNAKNFGIPQNRERVYMLLNRKDKPMVNLERLLEIKRPAKLKDILDFSTPTHTFKLSGDNFEIFKNYLVIPRASDGKVISGFHNRLWKTKNHIGCVTASAVPKFFYIKNEMVNYNGKIIQIDINKLLNQKPNEINTVALLGTVEGDEFDRKGVYESNGRFSAVDGISPTLAAKSYNKFQSKIMFIKDDDFKTKNYGAKDRFFGTEGVNGVLTATEASRNKIAFIRESHIGDSSVMGTDGVARSIKAQGSPTNNKIVFKIVSYEHEGLFTGVEGVSKTLIADPKNTNINKMMFLKDLTIHYRKITPLECWRLMGFDDDDYHKAKAAGVSDAQLCKQAGNSIVVNVLSALLGLDKKK